MTNINTDYPELLNARPPVPLMQASCSLCGGTGWRDTRVDELGGHGARCVWCGGQGYYWTELDELRDTAEEARRRLTRARYLP